MPGWRCCVHAQNLLGRFEIDRDVPELVPFNGWREKFFMDNPDYRYWITDIRDDDDYRITGNVGDSVYQSMTVYAGTNIATTTAVRASTVMPWRPTPTATSTSRCPAMPLGTAHGVELPQGSTSVLGVFSAAASEVSFVDLDYRELLANPAAALAIIYRAADMEPPVELDQFVAAYHSAHPVEGNRHRYAPAEFGLDENQLRDRFGFLAGSWPR